MALVHKNTPPIQVGTPIPQTGSDGQVRQVILPAVQVVDGSGNPAGAGTVAAPSVTQDQNSAAFSGEISMPVDGTTYAAGRSLKAICTVAGNVKVTYTDASTGIWALQVGTQTLPLAVTAWTVSAVTGAATATYANLK
jgi:hypothetical protein